MNRSAAQELNPAMLPPGTRIGPWEVRAYRGQGSWGAVYGAVQFGDPDLRPVALKVALNPGDERFIREGDLLARIRSPSVPRLLGRGHWEQPAGTTYPYLVMEWVEGSPLYDWAGRRNPSSCEVLQLLAQILRALEATHVVGGIHRDVKGENVLVRPSDGRAFLMDFGAGYHTGAARLTRRPPPPGTPAYRSPEAWEFVRRSWQDSMAYYVSRPSDDVFAVGVMAYRLVTDEYPPFTDPATEEGRCWRRGESGPTPPRVLNVRVDPQLNALILRMLSVRPESRGTPSELAAAMTMGIDYAPEEARAPLFEWETLEPSEWPSADAAFAEHLGHRPRRRSRTGVLAAERTEADTRALVLARERAPETRRTWKLALTAAIAAGIISPCFRGHGDRLARASLGQGGSDGGSTAVGDTAGTAPDTPLKEETKSRGVALDMPKEPFPGQLRPQANGRCHSRAQVAIYGGCWVKMAAGLDDCTEDGYVYGGRCYLPAFGRPRHPTSFPAGCSGRFE